jgi:hypothetical protein
MVSLRGYIAFWGCAFTLITLAIALFKAESDHFSEAREKREWRANHHRHARSASSSPGKALARLEAGTAGGPGGLKRSGWGGSGSRLAEWASAVGGASEWGQRRDEIVGAYVKLWGVVSVLI